MDNLKEEDLLRLELVLEVVEVGEAGDVDVGDEEERGAGASAPPGVITGVRIFSIPPTAPLTAVEEEGGG